MVVAVFSYLKMKLCMFCQCMIVTRKILHVCSVLQAKNWNQGASSKPRDERTLEQNLWKSVEVKVASL